MSIFKDSCRITERVAMKKLQSQGFTVKDISNHLRVKTHIIEEVLSGSWDALEKEQGLAAMQANEALMADKRDAEENKVAQIAAAAAMAIQNQMGQTASTDALRAEIEAKVRAEIAAEKTPGQKAAATRAANKERREQEEAESQEASTAA